MTTPNLRYTPPGTIAEMVAKYRRVVEIDYPERTGMDIWHRDHGCRMFLCFDDPNQKHPTWVYYTLPWVGPEVIKSADSVELYLWELWWNQRPPRAKEVIKANVPGFGDPS